MKSVFLIRHGESIHNAEGDCLSGVADVPLTDLGREQAKRLGLLLATLPIDTVYSSPLSRSMETAFLALPEFSDKVFRAQCLLELDYGDYDGLSSNKFNFNDPVIRAWEESPGSLCFPKGACISDHAEKALNGLLDITSSSSGTYLACFSHKTTIRLIVAKLLKIPLDHFRRVPCENASITMLSLEQHNLFVRMLNLTQEILRFSPRRVE